MKRKQKNWQEIDIKDMETSHIKNCIKAIKEWRIMKDYIEWTYWSEADETDAWYVDRSRDREKVLDEFERELNRREIIEMKEEMEKMRAELARLSQVNGKLKKSDSIINNLNHLCLDLEKDWVIEKFQDWDWDWEHWYVVDWYIYNWKPYEIDWYSF